MKLFKISQDVNTGYDTYDSAVVCAIDENEAKRIHPSILDWSEEHMTWGFAPGKGKRTSFEPYGLYGSWVTCIDEVKVEYIGEAKEGLEKGVICASFNAG